MKIKWLLIAEVSLTITAMLLAFLVNCPLLCLAVGALGLLAWVRATISKSQKQLDQQSLYFHALAESVEDLMSIQDQDKGADIFFNKRWHDYSGRDPNSKNFWAETIHPSDIEIVKTAYHGRAIQPDSYRFEYRLRRHDGTFRWHSCRGLPLRNKDGSIAKWITLSNDIHDQKMAETEKQTLWAELEEKTKMLTTVLEQMPSGVVISRPDCQVIFKNRKAIEFFNLDDKYTVGSLKGFHSDGRPYEHHEWPMIRALETGFTTEEEIFFDDGKGGRRCFRINAAPIISDRKTIAAVGIMDDLTDYKIQEAVQAKRQVDERAAIEIQRSQQMLETLFENIPSMILIKETKNLRYVKANRYALDALGKTESELIGKTSHDLMPKHQADELLAMDRETVREGKVVDVPRHQVTLKSSGTRTLHTKKFLLNPESQDPLLVAVSHDITEIIAGEKQMIRAREQAEQVGKLKSEFLANMSHEIRTPLNGVIGMTELLMDSGLNEQQARMTSIVQDSGNVLLALVNDILDFSKIEAGQLDLEKIEFESRLFFSSQIDILGIRAKAKGLGFSCHFDPNIPSCLKGDPGRIGQILTNLIGNAIKFTTHGQIDVRAELLEKNGRDISLRLSVTDSGIGLTAEQQNRLFKPFVQADGSFARKYGGTGLGLSISKKLAELMGGNITVESQKEQGSKFSFVVGLEQSDGNSLGKKYEAAPVKVPDSDLQKREKHILVAEDNKTNQILAVALLKKMGYIPHVVENGLEVLDAIQSFEYDLILMDCQMPELDGYEATAQIRELEKISKCHIPIVALTANAMKEDRDKCLSVGMDDFVSKPIKRDLLEEILKNWTTEKR